MTDSPTPVPRHIAVIMDGNGRWAKERELPRIKGHEEGANSVRELMKSAQKWGVEVLTLYAFSSENWKRPEEEVSSLMNLLPRMLIKHENLLHENQTRLRAIGRLEQLPEKTLKELNRVMESTQGYEEHQLVLALNYGSRDELVDAMRGIAAKVKTGELDPDQIEEADISHHLYAPDLPDPDYMIRTSGENRLSNFLLWQLSYAEFYFAPEYWPAFRGEAFDKAMEVYASRQRRYGGVEAC